MPMAQALAAAPPDVETPLRRLVRAYLSSKLAVFGLVLLAIVLCVAIAGPFLAPQNPYDLKVLDVMDSRLPPGEKSGDGKLTFLLGSDEQGRDMVSAIIYGIRTSVFTDVGTLGVLDDRYTTNTSGLPNANIVDELALRASAGVSIHWRSPMGPIRFDLSQIIGQEEYDKTETFRFSTSTQF